MKGNENSQNDGEPQIIAELLAQREIIPDFGKSIVWFRRRE